MGKTVTVDVKHQLGPEEAKRRVHDGMDALQHKLGDKNGAFKVDWGENHADILVTVMGHSLHGAMDFLPHCVRISLELPWALALIAEKIKGTISHQAGEMLHLPPPKA
ncbi:polyhydroxyalkanoic acid system family protein [uncultured Rhodoblastus sp.]|uniref:polyhydroxyalkanoic acid system family protein n=1 Tax=uncultured Rhodoblastus sp. TaxID=543037 RepID=UPI0025D11603|nr:polyhydroxyalkanoic acid system family protein [uncultured Rhodoblastus sp.]